MEMPLFSCGRLNKYFLLPFITPIICGIVNTISLFIEYENNFRNFELEIYIHYTSYILAGLFYLIKFSKKEERENEVKPLKINRLKMFLILFGLSISFCLCNLTFIMDGGKGYFEFWFFFLIFAILFSKYILKENIFKHQVLSIIISFIGFFIIYIPIIIQIEKEKIYIYFFYIFSSLFYCIFIIGLKYLLNDYFLSSFLSSLIIGIICLLLYSIGLCFYSLYIYKDFSFLINLFNINNKIGIKLYIYYFIFIILDIFLKILTLSLINHFSPILYFITEIISPILTTLIQKIFLEKDKENFIFITPHIIGNVFQIIAILFYNEIIILNRCGLNENTNVFIKQRELEEKFGLMNDIKNLKENKDEVSFFELDNYKIKLRDDIL